MDPLSSLDAWFLYIENEFNHMHVAVIAAGERSGNLEQSLVGLAELVERGMAMRRRVISALIYPFLLFNVIALIPAGVRAFFPATQNVFSVDPLPLLIGFYVVLIGVFLAAKLVGAMGALKSLCEGILLLVPFIGGIWRKAYLLFAETGNPPAKVVFAEDFETDDWRGKVHVKPDAGGVERARSYAKQMGVSLAIIDKRRDAINEAKAMHIIGNVRGKIAIVVDDMIDTAGTLMEAVGALLREGAVEVHACCTHAVLSGPAIEHHIFNRLA